MAHNSFHHFFPHSHCCNMTQGVRLGACSTLGLQGVGLHRLAPQHGSGVCRRPVGWVPMTQRNRGMSGMPHILSAASEVESRTEVFLKELEEEGEDHEVSEMRSAVDDLTEEVMLLPLQAGLLQGNLSRWWWLLVRGSPHR